MTPCYHVWLLEGTWAYSPIGGNAAKIHFHEFPRCCKCGIWLDLLWALAVNPNRYNGPTLPPSRL